MQELKKVKKLCLECRICVDECLYLQKLGHTPRELAELLEAEAHVTNPESVYLCNLCDLCQEVCPQELNIGKLSQKVRLALVAEGKGPDVQLALVNRDLKYTNSEAFSLALPNSHPLKGAESYVFFPGCSLSGYSTELVLKAYSYLRDYLPIAGIILKCCGAPSLFIGQGEGLEANQKEIAAMVGALGGNRILTACPDCNHIFKKRNPDLRPITLYEVIDKEGLPLPTGGEGVFSLHDSCKSRWEKGIQESSRSLITKMGYAIEEMAHSREDTLCCGNGGMVPYFSPEFFAQLVARRTSETPHTILTYCGGCRETLASGGKATLHLLDLIFNSHWRSLQYKPSLKPKERRESQARLKKMLLDCH